MLSLLKAPLRVTPYVIKGILACRYMTNWRTIRLTQLIRSLRVKTCIANSYEWLNSEF